MRTIFTVIVLLLVSSQAKAQYFEFETDSNLIAFQGKTTQVIDTIIGSAEKPERVGPDWHSHEATIRFTITSEIGSIQLSASSCQFNAYLPIKVRLELDEYGTVLVSGQECGATAYVGYRELIPPSEDTSD